MAGELGPRAFDLGEGPFDLRAPLVERRLFGCRGGKTSYDRVLAFRLAEDNTVRLLRRLPDRLLPPEAVAAAAAYDPLARLGPGPVGELKYFRYPGWVERPAVSSRALWRCAIT